MIQLSVSIRDAAVRLSDARGSITLTHQTDLPGLEVGVRKLAVDIEHVVAQLQQRERELSRSEQLARLGQLAAGMAHELRNPLMPMKILVQSAMEKEDGLQGRQLDVIHEEIQRLEKSIQAFLDFAKPPIPEKQVCSLSEIVRSTTELVRGRCVQQQVELVMSLPEASLNAYVDRNQICQLLLNLLLNSLDAMPEGGKLEVSLDTWLSSSNATVFKQNREEMLNQFHAIRSKVATTVSGLSETIPKKSYQQWMDLCVTDNGIGIDAHGMENLFLPFSTTKETGSGLGLATCDRIAQAHGGVIEVESQPGIRTLFRFSFPAPELPLS
jgi:signal transduction histidine kinase